MSHVDEGALHAYLDGALDEYPAAEARRIRGHVETCATCADKLLEERRVREEARAILGQAVPDVEVPTFEELRAYVRASRPPRTPATVRLQRLGWAASVALALGTGWVLRGGRGVQLTNAASEASSGSSVATGPAEPQAPLAATPATGGAGIAGGRQVGGGASSAPQRARAVGDASPARPDESTPAASLVAGRPQSTDGSDGPIRSDESSERGGASTLDAGAAPTAAEPSFNLDGTAAAGLPAPPIPGPAPLTAPPATVELRGTVAERQAPGSADGNAGQAGAGRRPSQGRVLTSAISAAPNLEPGTANRTADVEESSDADSGSLVVPGLELIAVLPVREGRTFEGMRALQRLENGDTLEVVHLAEGVTPATLAPVREGSREIVLQRGAGWIVLRARRTEVELLALLQRLEAGN